MPGINEIREKKRELRGQYKKIRREIDENVKNEMDNMIFSHFVSSMSYKYGKKFLLFYSLEEEPNMVKIIDFLLSQSKQVFLPRTYSDGIMRFFKVTNIGELVTGKFGVPEPNENGEEYTQSTDGTDICLVPGLCFDNYGYRLGYGKGFYDRFLSRFDGVKIGVTYSALITENPLPREKRYDKNVDFLICEKEMKPVVS